MNTRRFGRIPVLFVVALASCSDDGPTATNGTSTPVTGPSETSPRTDTPVTEGSAAEPPGSELVVEVTDSTSTPPTVPENSLTYVEEEDSVLAVVAARNDTTRFVQLANALGSDDVFRQERGVTLLVPVDSAWDAYGEDEFDALLGDPNAIALLLSEHLAIGAYSVDELLATGQLSTAMARTLPIVAANGSITIGETTVFEADLRAKNGVVHLIDAVIGPSS